MSRRRCWRSGRKPRPACGFSWWTTSTPCARDRKSTRLNSSHVRISYAVFCLKKKKKHQQHMTVPNQQEAPGLEARVTRMQARPNATYRTTNHSSCPQHGSQTALDADEAESP